MTADPTNPQSLSDEPLPFDVPSMPGARRGGRSPKELLAALRSEREAREAEQAARTAPKVSFDADLVPDLGEQQRHRTAPVSDLDRVINGTDILEVYARVCGKMTPRPGTKRESIMISCPRRDHQDDVPSAWVSLDKQTWYCAPCADGGDAITMYARTQGIYGTDYQAPGVFPNLKEELGTALGWIKPAIAGRGANTRAPRGTTVPLTAGHAPVEGGVEPGRPELDPAALQGLAGDVVSAIAPTTEASPAAILFQLLVTYGNVIDHRPFCLAEDTPHHFNLFAVLVGDSSKSRKGTSWRRISSLFDHVDEEWVRGCVKDGLTSGEGLVFHIRDPRFEPAKAKAGVAPGAPVMVDAGVADKRLLCQEGEFVGVLQTSSRPGNPLTARLRQLWDSGNVNTLTKNSPDSATNAHVSIVGHITVDELVRNLDSIEMSNGFANRFLWVYVERAQLLPFPVAVDPAVRARLVERLKSAVAFGSSAGYVKWSESASALWIARYEELSQARAGLVGSATSRGEAQVLRLAGLYALLDSTCTIEVEHLEAAMAVWNYSLDSAFWIWGNRSGVPLADKLDRLLAQSVTGELTRTEIYKALSGHARKPAVDEALAALESSGRAKPSRAATGGRPAETWTRVVVDEPS